MVTGTPALLLGTLAQLVSPWYFDMITAFIPKWYSKNLLPSTLTTIIRWLKIVRVPGTANILSQKVLNHLTGYRHIRNHLKVLPSASP